MSWRGSRERNKRLKRIADTKTRPFRGAYYDDDKHRIIRYYVGKRGKLLRRVLNKRIRRYGKPFADHGAYRKLYEYWWELD